MSDGILRGLLARVHRCAESNVSSEAVWRPFRSAEGAARWLALPLGSDPAL